MMGEMEEPRTFANVLDRLVKARGMSHNAVLDRLRTRGFRVHKSTFSKWISGDRQPKDRDLIITLAKALECGLLETANLLASAGLHGIRRGEMDHRVTEMLGAFPILCHKVYFLRVDLGWDDDDVRHKLPVRQSEIADCVEQVERELVSLRTGAQYRYERHVGYLSDCVATVRSLLRDPRFEVYRDDKHIPMQVDGVDWRLEPRVWEGITVPDLDESARPYWGEELPQLQQHLSDNPFWNELNEFTSHAQNLWQSYLEAMSKVLNVPIDQVPQGMANEIRFVDARIPGNVVDTPLPSPYSSEEYDRAMGRIREADSTGYEGIVAAQQDLDLRLRRLNDLLKDKLAIDKVIYDGICDACRSFKPADRGSSPP